MSKSPKKYFFNSKAGFIKKLVNYINKRSEGLGWTSKWGGYIAIYYMSLLQ